MKKKILKALPDDYAEVIVNPRSISKNCNICVCVPIFRRAVFVERMLQSLQRSNLENCLLILIDESSSNLDAGNDFRNYELITNIDFWGGDITKVHGGLEQVKREADQNQECIAFNENGWLKRDLGPPIAIHNTVFRTFVKKTYLKDRPHILALSQNMRSCFDRTTSIVEDFLLPNTPIIKIYKKRHGNMFDSFLNSFDLIIKLELDIDYFVTLDSDTIHKRDWLVILRDTFLRAQKQFPDKPIILSGFDTRAKPYREEHELFNEKINIGGINMFFDKKTYLEHVRRFLVNLYWDHNLCEEIVQQGGRLLTLKRSVIQHIGSSGIWSNAERFDKADDFHP